MKTLIRSLLTITISVTTVLILPGCEDQFSDSPQSGTVRYEVKCSPGGFDITYQNSSGNTEQRDVSSGRWSTSFTASQGDFVYISAQAGNENATVSAKIYYNDNLIEQASSSGDYVIATASGSIP